MIFDSDSEVYGFCDCGFQYIKGSRFDHDADSGQCWNCSDRNIWHMTDSEMEDYLLGM